MKQLVVSACLLSTYSAIDTLLTIIGLNLGGLREANPFAVIFIDAFGIILGLVLHFIISSVFLVVFSVLAYVEGKCLNLEYLAHTVINAITVIYVYVLIHNLYMIWRYVR